MVPNVLKLAVPFDGSGVLLPVPPPVVRVAGAPFLRAVPAFLPIFRVCRDFLAVIIGATAPLAVGRAANRLPWLIFRWLGALLTVAATTLDHTGVVASAADAFSGRGVGEI